MTTISAPVKPVDHHPDPSQPFAASPASVVDLFEARRRRPSESEKTSKEAPIEQGHRRAIYWLISLAVLISLLVGILCLMKPVTMQTNLPAEGAPSQVEVTIGEAIQALSIRH